MGIRRSSSPVSRVLVVVARISWGLAGLGATVGIGVTVTVEGGGAWRVVVTVGVDMVPQLVATRTTPINSNIDINDNNILVFTKKYLS
jgi:hypothetical protein